MSLSTSYNTSNPGSAVSNYEGLTNTLTQFAPEQTPVLSMAPKKNTGSTFPEWTLDKLKAVSTDGINEGVDVQNFEDKFADRIRVGNYVQKFQETWGVTDFQQAADSVGPAHIAQAEAKAITEIKRNIEATILSSNAQQQEAGAGNPYKTGGFDWFLDSTGPSIFNSSDYYTPAASIHSSGAFTEIVMNDIITSIFRKRGVSADLTLVADTALRNLISRTFTNVTGSTDSYMRSVNVDSKKREIIQSVEIYRGDHGNISIMNGNPDCMPDTTNADYGFFLNPNYYCIYEYVNMVSKQLEDRGAGPRGYCKCMVGLGVDHPQAHGKVTVIA